MANHIRLVEWNELQQWTHSNGFFAASTKCCLRTRLYQYSWDDVKFRKPRSFCQSCTPFIPVSLLIGPSNFFHKTVPCKTHFFLLTRHLFTSEQQKAIHICCQRQNAKCLELLLARGAEYFPVCLLTFREQMSSFLIVSFAGKVAQIWTVYWDSEANNDKRY